MKNFAMLTIVSAAAALLVIAGCDDQQDTTAPAAAAATPAASTAALPADLVVAEPPAGAQAVTAAKQTVKDGDAVVIRGKIGGGEQPIAPNRALMTILDPSVITCDTMPGDTCKTPWDACCEPSEKIAANSATVQVVDGNGKPLPTTLENVAGLKPLSKVTVSGIARRPAGSDTLIVEAKQIHVTP